MAWYLKWECRMHFRTRSGYSSTECKEDLKLYDLKDRKDAQKKADKIIKEVTNARHPWVQDDVNFQLVWEE